MTLFDSAFVRGVGIGGRTVASNALRRWTAAQGAGGIDMPSGGDDKRSKLTPVIAIADKQSARIIGVTSCQNDAGVSLVARRLAQTFASFGRRSLLVDASRLAPIQPGTERNELPYSDSVVADPFLDDQIETLDLAAVSDWPVGSREECRQALEALARNSCTVVVDLPPIIQPTGKPTLLMQTVGAACDLTFLVCLSGKTERRSLKAAVEAAGIFKMTIGGIILNDWQLPLSQMLDQ